VLDSADQVVGGRVAGREERVRHARDRQLSERLAASVARGLHAILPRAQQVVQVGAEPPLLDHGRAARGRALVVHALAAPGVRAAAVVIGRDEPGRHLLPKPPGVHARVLLDCVRLEAVADRLVEQHAAEAVPHHHRQAAGGRVDRVQQRERPPRRLLGHLLRAVLEQLPPRVPAARVGAGLHAAVPTRHHLGAQPDAGAVVCRGAAVGPVHLDLAVVLGVADAGLGDLGAGGAGALVADPQELGLPARLDLLRRRADRVGRMRLHRAQRRRLPCVAAYGLGHRAGHPQQVLLREAVHVAVVGRVALHHSHAGAALATALRALHAAVVHRDRKAAPRLRVHLRHVAAPRQRALEHARRQVGVDQRHSRPATSVSISSATPMIRSWPRASG
jgi:hypothetical protein